MASDITLKIHQGTGRLTGVNLCRSCSNAMVREDQQGEQIFCQAVGIAGAMVRSNVRTCSMYNNKALPSMYDLRQIAWTLRTENDGRKIGFTPPKQRGNDFPPDD